MGIELKVGQKAPTFSLPRDGGGKLSLADFKGQACHLFLSPGRYARLHA